MPVHSKHAEQYGENPDCNKIILFGHRVRKPDDFEQECKEYDQAEARKDWEIV
jgi:hypothetical protein